MEENTYNIGIKVESYEELFNKLDYRPLDIRELSEDVDNFIDKFILKSDKKIKNMMLKLIIYLPKSVKDYTKENNTQLGIINHYKSIFEYQKKIKILSIKRITYYAICSLILSAGWYYMVTYKNQNFISSLLNAGGTVLLWEIMSLVFIERKNAKDRAALNRKLSNMKIVFEYI